MIYLDNSATTFPKPQCVYDALKSTYMLYGVNPGRGGYELAQEAENIIVKTRKLIAKFFNLPDWKKVIFAMNATMALNMAINGIICENEHVITTTLEHNSVLRPLNYLKYEKNVKVSYVNFNKDGFVSPEDIANEIKPETKMVIINHASNVIGTIQHIMEIGKLCKDNNILLLVDGSQSAGIIPINIKEMNISLFAFTGHKSLMGPMGIGGLCVNNDIELKPIFSGGTGIRSADELQPEKYPWCLEAGTPNLPGIAALYEGMRYISEKGINAIYEKEMDLFEHFISQLKQINKVKLYCMNSLKNHIPVTSFEIEGTIPKEIGRRLDASYDIACRSGLHCAPLVHKSLQTEVNGLIRFSFGMFNTKNDVDVVLNAINEISQ